MTGGWQVAYSGGCRNGREHNSTLADRHGKNTLAGLRFGEKKPTARLGKKRGETIARGADGARAPAISKKGSPSRRFCFDDQSATGPWGDREIWGE